MTKKEIIDIIDVLLSNESKYDMIQQIKIKYPKYADVIDAKVNEDDSENDFEEKVYKKAKELFVYDGHFVEHFMRPRSDHYKYVEQARKLLRGE